MKNLLTLCFVLSVLAVSAHAAIHRVSPNGSAPYTNISQAYTAAANGDTIIVGPGVYTDAFASAKRLKIIGAGWDQVSMGYFYFTTGSSGSLLEGMRIENVGASQTVYAYFPADSITMRRCFLYNSSVYPCFERQNTASAKWTTIEDCILLGTGTNNGNQDLIRSAQDSMIVRNCLLAHANANVAGQSVIDGNPRFLTFVNNVCVNIRDLFNLTGTFGMYAANNIVWDWNASGTWGTYSPSALFDYNASQTPAPPGTNGQTLASDPFVNYNEASGYEHGISDFHLAGGSSLIDAGVPSLLDRNGTRSDLGIYGGPYQFVENGVPAYPFVISVVAPPAIISGDSLNVNTIGRVGPRY